VHTKCPAEYSHQKEYKIEERSGGPWNSIACEKSDAKHKGQINMQSTLFSGTVR
jgi:hypothetical protein